MKLEMMYATRYRTCETCCGTGTIPSADTQQSCNAEGGAAGRRVIHHNMKIDHDRAYNHTDSKKDAYVLCDQCAGVGSVRVERIAALSLEASIISFCIASCAAAYTGRPLLIALLLAIVMFAARMVSFRTERYLLTKRHTSSRASSSSIGAGS